MFSSLELRGLAQRLMMPHTLSLNQQTIQQAQCNQAGDVLLLSAKPRLARHTARQRGVIRHSPDQFPTAPVPVAACLTALLLTLGFLFDDVRLACSCSAMKLPTHNFYYRVIASGSVQLCSYRANTALVAFTHCEPQCVAIPFCDFTRSATSWLSFWCS